MNEKLEPRLRQVFLSYASADKSIAKRLASALQDAGIPVWFDEWELRPGDSLVDRVARSVSPNDILILLLSRHSMESRWVAHELTSSIGTELRDRAVTVLPVLIDDSHLPPQFLARAYLDLRDFDEGVSNLVQQISALPAVDYSKLNPRSFEHLVADLLAELGFSVVLTPPARDPGYDIVATFKSIDPFGGERAETWFVEVKYYRNERVSVASLREMVGLLLTSGVGNRGLVVTNGQLTSVSRNFVGDVSKRFGQYLRVIDGTELTALLMRHPDLIARHFHERASQ